jgi:hypothetical protein
VSGATDYLNQKFLNSVVWGQEERENKAKKAYTALEDEKKKFESELGKQQKDHLNATEKAYNR